MKTQIAVSYDDESWWVYNSIILHLSYIADQKTTNFTLFNIGFEVGLYL